MISIDIETTGPDPDVHQILEFAAVLENGSSFCVTIKYENYVISPFCLKLHKDLLQECEDFDILIRDLEHSFRRWLRKHEIKIPYQVVGADFGSFNGCFLKKVLNFPPWSHRVLEIGSLYFDGILPQKLADIEKSTTPHRALPDAEAVMRAYLRKKND